MEKPMQCPCCEYVANGESNFGNIYLLLAHTRKMANGGDAAHRRQYSWMLEKLNEGVDDRVPLAVQKAGVA